jgi:hypothetical protein
MSKTDSPLDPIYFGGYCSECGEYVSRPVPGKEHFNQMKCGLWVRFSCGKINYLEKE